jgi:hypothetical protein
MVFGRHTGSKSSIYAFQENMSHALITKAYSTTDLRHCQQRRPAQGRRSRKAPAAMKIPGQLNTDADGNRLEAGWNYRIVSSGLLLPVRKA